MQSASRPRRRQSPKCKTVLIQLDQRQFLFVQKSEGTEAFLQKSYLKERRSVQPNPGREPDGVYVGLGC